MVHMLWRKNNACIKESGWGIFLWGVEQGTAERWQVNRHLKEEWAGDNIILVSVCLGEGIDSAKVLRKVVVLETVSWCVFPWSPSLSHNLGSKWWILLNLLQSSMHPLKNLETVPRNCYHKLPWTNKLGVPVGISIFCPAFKDT